MTDQHGSDGISRRGLIAGATAGAAAVAVGGVSTADAEQPAVKAAGKELRVAQIGVQGHFGDVVSGIPKLANCRLVAAARSWSEENMDRLRRSRVCTEQTPIYDDYVKMLDEIKPDMVAVFAPFARNGKVNVQAAKRGCHVFSEKPIAVSMADLDALRAARDKMKIHVTAMLPMRSFSVFAAAHDAVKRGLIGEPVLVSAQKSYKWGARRQWYYKERETYGGTIPWVAIHAIDFIRYVSGLEFARVTAHQAVKSDRGYPGCEDCGALLFEMTNGGQGTLTFDYFRPNKAASHGDDRLRVVGTKGIVELRQTDKEFCELVTNDAAPKQLPLPDSRKNVFVDFVDSIREGKPHMLSPEDPFRAAEVAIKARQSADKRVTVAL